MLDDNDEDFYSGSDDDAAAAIDSHEAGVADYEFIDNDSDDYNDVASHRYQVYVIGEEGILKELELAGYHYVGGPEDGGKKIDLKPGFLMEHDENCTCYMYCIWSSLVAINVYVKEACKEWGFFHIKNHGVSKDLYKKLYSLSNHIFSLPLESKLKAGPSSKIKTFTPHFIASPFFESLRVSGPDFFASAQNSAKVLLKQQSSELSEILKEYGSKMTELSKRITEVVLMSLGENFVKEFFDSEFHNCQGYLRIINYSPPQAVSEQGVEGLGMHTDMSCITTVYQDEIGGLQVRSKEGKWMDIEPCAETLVVNIGDLMQAWSNGKLRSSEHKVVLKKCVSRFSLAFFWCFEDEKVIYAPQEVVGEGNLRVYKPFVCEDYLKFRESNEEGKFEKVGFTVKEFAGITG